MSNSQQQPPYYVSKSPSLKKSPMIRKSPLLRKPLVKSPNVRKSPNIRKIMALSARLAKQQSAQGGESSVGGQSSFCYDSIGGMDALIDGIPLPIALWPMVRRLESEPDIISELDVLNVTFIVRLADAMHKVAYATFLTYSFVDELRKKLNVPDLDLEIDVHANRWSYRQGSLMVYHRIRWDYDGSAMNELSKIALGVLEDRIYVPEAIVLIHELEEENHYSAFENFYRRFPGRILIHPLLASTGSVMFFKGTLIDLQFGLVTGLAAGFLHYCSARFKSLTDVEELLIGISTAFIAVGATTLFPDRECFTALVLGTLLWFLYGLAFMVSLYEVTQHLLLTGLTRFALAVLNSFILAFGVVIGVWMASYGGEDRFDNILNQDCSKLENPVHPAIYIIILPLLSIGVFMHLRISPKHWVISMVVVVVAVSSQYVIGTLWHQPVFVSNVLPAYLATLTAHISIVIGHKLRLTPLDVEPTAYLQKKKTDDFKTFKPDESPHLLHRQRDKQEQEKSDQPTAAHHQKTSSFNFIDDGWADEGLSMDGYYRDDRLQYQRSDLWFCLLPALYVMVPGSSVWRIAFLSIMQQPGSNSSTNNSGSSFSLEAMISGIFIVGIGQVIGVRLGMTTLWVVQALAAEWVPQAEKSEETIPLVLNVPRGQLDDGDTTDGESIGKRFKASDSL